MPTDFRSRIIVSAKSSAEKVFAATARAGGKVADSLIGITKAGVAAGAAVAVAFAVSSVRKAAKFQSTILELSAITGATGEDLKFMADAAKEFGAASTFGATAAAEAFKLVASAKPDLLANKEALAATTQQVILLSEATGNTLAASANTVGEALNQFGEEASEAARFVNVLAAGAKFGSSEVIDTAAALKKAGVAAKGAGVSFEETNAAIQVLAGVGIKGAEAGTALRGVFLKLQTQADDNFNPAIVGINEALANLADANLSAADKVKLFGQENFVAASSLIENRENLSRLTGELTGTNVAVEQAAKRQEGFEAQLKIASAALETLQINLGEKLLPVLTDIVRIVADVINSFSDQTDEIEDADVAFADLDATIRTVVGTFSVVKAAITVIGKALGGFIAAVATAISGDFAQVDDVLRAAFEDMKNTAVEGFEQAARITRETTPKVVADALSNPIIVEAAGAAGKTVGKAFFEGIATPSTEAANTAAATQLAALAVRVENIRAGTLTEVEAENERFETLRGVLFQGRLAQLEDDATLDAILEAAKLKHEENLTNIANSALTKRRTFEEMSTKQKSAFVLGTLQSLTQGVATQNKAMFRINQAAAIGSAIINTAAGITEMMKLPWPLNLAMAAVVAASGAAQIATIASAKPGGGTTPSVSASTPTLAGQPVAAGGPQALGGPGGGFGTQIPGQAITINIDGLPTSGMMQAETVRELMSSINDQLGDGVVIDVDGGSAGGTAGTQSGGT